MKKILLILLLVICLIGVYLFFVPKQRQVSWGVNFSQAQAINLGLDWKRTYTAILEDLQPKKVKLITQWDLLQPNSDHYYFDDIDWQLQQAQNYSAKIIYVVGMKTGRWPECHIPDWASGLSKQEQQNELLAYVKEVVERYKDNKSIVYWQAENEPLFQFGECPWYDEDFLKREVGLIKYLDPTRQVIVSDTGEWSWWFRAANIGDIVGTTMYRKVWFDIFNGYGFYVTSFLPPQTYGLKAQIIKQVFGKEVINVELQAEPWTHAYVSETSIREQQKTMDLSAFKANIDYAKNSGLEEFYFWGAEWWYWMKETQNMPEIWKEAKELF